LWDFENLHCSLLQISEYVIFAQLKIKGILVWKFSWLQITTLSTCRFNFILFETSKWYFWIFSKNELHVARATLVVFSMNSCYKFLWTLLNSSDHNCLFEPWRVANPLFIPVCS
jgi:hypothetical protein